MLNRSKYSTKPRMRPQVPHEHKHVQRANNRLQSAKIELNDTVLKPIDRADTRKANQAKLDDFHGSLKPIRGASQ